MIFLIIDIATKDDTLNIGVDENNCQQDKKHTTCKLDRYYNISSGHKNLSININLKILVGPKS